LELRIVGGGSERFLSEARTVAVALGLLHVVNPSVRFMGNLNSEAVAVEMQNADVLVLFSEMENAPCVISEALCCGLPVISSAVAGIPEMLNQDNGLMVDSGDEKGLVVAMAKAIEANGTWDREKIADAAQRIYGFDAVGEILNESYRNLM
jgi:glycosyltransferase involved in cell wall biosynthesis